jgi:predicted nucleic acid-binding protein
MGSRRLEPEINRYARIAVDTAPLIYFLEDIEPWVSIVRRVIDRAIRGGCVAVVSAVTEVELRVGPLTRDPADVDAVERLLSLKGVEVSPVSRAVAREAASFRARYRLSLPDAVVAATASTEGCGALLANDDVFKRLAAPWKYLHLDDYVKR